MRLLTKFCQQFWAELYGKSSNQKQEQTKICVKNLSFYRDPKCVKMTLWTMFYQNTIILSRFILRKLSTNQNAGIKLNMRESSWASNFTWRVKMSLLAKFCRNTTILSKYIVQKLLNTWMDVCLNGQTQQWPTKRMSRNLTGSRLYTLYVYIYTKIFKWPQS